MMKKVIKMLNKDGRKIKEKQALLYAYKHQRKKVRFNNMVLKYVDAEGNSRVATGKKHGNKWKWSGIVVSGEDRKRTNVTAETVAKASAKLKKKIETYRQQKDFVLNVTTVAQMLDFHLDFVKFRYTNGTNKRNEHIAKDIKRKFGHRKFKDLKAHEVQKYVDEITQKAIEARKKYEETNDIRVLKGSGDHAVDIKRLLKQAFNTMIQNGYHGMNPIEFVTPISAEKKMVAKLKKLDVYTAEQMAIWDKYIKADTSGEKGRVHATHMRTKAIVALAIATGMRIGEIFALKWEDIDLEGRTLKVKATRDRVTNELKRTKTKSGTRIAVITDYIEFFKEYRAWGIAMAKERREKVPEFFCDTHTAKANVSGYQGSVIKCREICELMGIPWHGFHSFRRTFVTNLAKKGVRDTLIAEQVGHKGTATLATYTYEDVMDLGKYEMMATIRNAENIERHIEQVQNNALEGIN